MKAKQHAFYKSLVERYWGKMHYYIDIEANYKSKNLHQCSWLPQQYLTIHNNTYMGKQNSIAIKYTYLLQVQLQLHYRVCNKIRLLNSKLKLWGINKACVRFTRITLLQETVNARKTSAYCFGYCLYVAQGKRCGTASTLHHYY